jgi:hypothetical protein
MVEPEEGKDAEASVRRELDMLMQESRELMGKLSEDSLEQISETLNRSASPLSKLMKERLMDEGGDGGAVVSREIPLAGSPLSPGAAATRDESHYWGDRNGERAGSREIAAVSLGQTSEGRSEGGAIAQSVAELIKESEALLDQLPQESVTSLSAGHANPDPLISYCVPKHQTSN